MEYTVYKSDLKSINTIAALFSSSVRLEMYMILLKEKLSVTDLARRVGISTATASTHIAKLEGGEVIRVEYVNVGGANKKMCSAKFTKISINFSDIKKHRII